MATPRLCLETDIIIDYLRRYNDVLERVLIDFDCALAAVTVYELEIGLARAPRQKILFEDLINIVIVLPLDYAAAKIAARVYNDLRVQGQLIGVQDMLIAGICIAYDVPLLTRNLKHYERIEDLPIIEVDQLLEM